MLGDYLTSAPVPVDCFILDPKLAKHTDSLRSDSIQTLIEHFISRGKKTLKTKGLDLSKQLCFGMGVRVLV